MAQISKVKRRLALKKAVLDYHSLSYTSDIKVIEARLDNEEAIISAATELLNKLTAEDPRYARLLKENKNAVV